LPNIVDDTFALAISSASAASPKIVATGLDMITSQKAGQKHFLFLIDDC
jgi:hypothetical protein